jgi:hypothetical protein
MAAEPELIEELVHLLLALTSGERLEFENRQNVLLDG